jgi:NADH-quinone oxidoreductase subunit N
MFSMSGIPPLAGFFSKLAVFREAVQGGYYILALLGVLTSVVAAYYYLKVVKVMMFDEAQEPFDRDNALSVRAVLFFAALFSVLFIVKPEPVISLAYSAAASLF